jgi:urease accessory protein
MTTTSQHSLLHLLTWLSPAFPTGAFAYSQGLEWLVEAGEIINVETLHTWLLDVLLHGNGRSDCILLREAHRRTFAGTSTSNIISISTSASSSEERQIETLQQGRAFTLAVSTWVDIVDAPYAVAVGTAAGRTGIPENDTVLAYLQAFASNLVSAAVRLVPLGQTAGLRVLAMLEQTILGVAETTCTETIEDLGNCTFRSDLASMCHERQYTRLFRS